MGRYNDPGLLTAWRTTGAFPEIHRAITDAIVEHDAARRGIDLCCSTGLLARSLTCQGFTVLGVDGDAAAVAAGMAAGPGVDLLPLTLDRGGLAALLRMATDRGLTSLYARRCLPELFGRDLATGRWFFREAVNAGISRLFIQGRNPSANARTPLFSVFAEIDVAGVAFSLKWQRGQVAYLESNVP